MRLSQGLGSLVKDDLKPEEGEGEPSFVEYLLSAKNFIYIGSLNLYKNPMMYDSCSDLKQRK